MLTTINDITNNALIFFNTIAAGSGGDSPDFSNLSATVVTWLNAFLIPVFVIIGGFSIFKLISLGWKIAHSADQPDERRVAIIGIVWWALGLVISIAAPVLVNVLLPSLIKAAHGGYVPPSS